MIEARPSVHRKRLGPKWLHLLVYYTWIPPSIKSVSVQSGRDMTHSLKTGRNTFTIPGLVSFRTGGKRASRPRSSRRNVSGCLAYIFITLVAVVVTAALLAHFYLIPTVTTWLHSVSDQFGR